MRVTILNTETGEKAIHPYDISPFELYEGNYSCDCNRLIPFGKRGDWARGVCLGCHKYLVCDFEYKPEEIAAGWNYTLDDFNADYPKELRDAWLKESTNVG